MTQTLLSASSATTISPTTQPSSNAPTQTLLDHVLWSDFAATQPPTHNFHPNAPHNAPRPFYHLLTITGLTTLGYAPTTEAEQAHYLAWAPVFNCGQHPTNPTNPTNPTELDHHLTTSNLAQHFANLQADQPTFH